MTGTINQDGSNYKGYAVVSNASAGDLDNGPWRATYSIHEPGGELVKEGHCEGEFDTEAAARACAIEKAHDYIDKMSDG
jgi:hypothetical protein